MYFALFRARIRDATYQGRRAPLRFTLALAFIFSAFGAEIPVTTLARASLDYRGSCLLETLENNRQLKLIGH